MNLVDPELVEVAMLFDSSNLELLINIVKRTADEEIIPRFRRLGVDNIREKTSSLDLVPDADLAAEVSIRVALTDIFPEALCIGEEAVAKNSHLLDQIADAQLAFIIDPIDGPQTLPGACLSSGY